jgi:hypothetical protein
MGDLARATVIGERRCSTIVARNIGYELSGTHRADVVGSARRLRLDLRRAEGVGSVTQGSGSSHW